MEGAHTEIWWHEAPTEREAREVISRGQAEGAHTEIRRREASTDRKAREVILRGIDVQCNKRSPSKYNV